MSGTCLRWVPDLGMHALDRGHGSCVWATAACVRCFNEDIARFCPWMKKAWEPGGSDDQRWDAATAETFMDQPRVRLCTRGEPVMVLDDVHRIAWWARQNPVTLFWLTTRCWQLGVEKNHMLNFPFIEMVERLLHRLPNVRVLASVDPYTAHYLLPLAGAGWSTAYFGSELPHPNPGAFRCPKTWDNEHGACATCEDGCFSAEPVSVWFKEHGSHKKPTPQLELFG